MVRAMMGIMAQFEKVAFKKDGITVFEATGSLGCIRSPDDDMKLVTQGYNQLFNAVDDKKVSADALDYTSVEVRGREYSKADLKRANAIPTNRGVNPPKRK